MRPPNATIGACDLCGQAVVYLEARQMRFDLRHSSVEQVVRGAILLRGRCPACNALCRVSVEVEMQRGAVE